MDAMKNEFDIDLFATTVYRIVTDYFDVTIYRPAASNVVFIANPRLHKRGWKGEMGRRLASVQARARIERDQETYRVTITPLPRTIGRPPTLNAVLFVATFLTVLAAAAYREVGDALFSDPALALKGLPFTLTLLTILLVHEMGHFWAGYRRRVIMSYPFFIPAPTFLGTFGAVIRTRSPIRNRNDLILIGASGPLAGAVPAVLAIIVGYATSDIVLRTGLPMFTFGHSLLTLILQSIFFGDVSPGMMVRFSPVALAGSVGLLVTMLNLLPLGQLDGGHIMYGLFRKGQHRLAALFMISLVGLGFLWPGWWIWLVLALVMRPFHPPLIDESLVPDGRHKKIGWVAVALFILTFAPRPIY
jgi:membrane-associated protease RseP (regulator of RpoE activity)